MWELYGWCVGCRVAIDLVAAEDHKVGLFFVEHLVDKVEGSWICFAFSTGIAVGHWFAALAYTVAEMQVADLHDFEFAIVPDSGFGLLALLGSAAADGEVDAEKGAAGVEQQLGACYSPTVTRFDGIVAKEDVDVGDDIVGVAGLFVARPLNPQTARPGFPFFVGFRGLGVLGLRRV